MFASGLQCENLTPKKTSDHLSVTKSREDEPEAEFGLAGMAVWPGGGETKFEYRLQGPGKLYCFGCLFIVCMVGSIVECLVILFNLLADNTADFVWTS